MKIYGKGKPVRKRLLNQDKGQSQMMRQVLQRIKTGGEPLISPAEIFAGTQACFAALESIKTRQPVSIR
jgi:predicted dehydrogenase